MFDSDQGILPDVVHDTLRKWLWVPWMVILCVLLGAIVQVAVWWFDTKPPFQLLSYTASPVRPGETLKIDGKVRRDLGRGCSLMGSRYIMDSTGTRYDMGSSALMTPSALSTMDAMSPGEIHQKFVIPLSIAPGKAVITTTMRYTCNPVHEMVKPIPVEMVIPFEVLP